MVWDNQPLAGSMPSAEPEFPAAAPECDGNLGMQGWEMLVPGPCGPQEGGLEEILSKWRTSIQTYLHVASLQVW